MKHAARLGAMGLATVLLAGATVAFAQPSQQPVNDRPESMQSAVTSPAEDLNLRRTPIPEVLQRSAVNPYDMRDMDRCPNIAAEVMRLDAALGPDQDAPQVDDRSRGEKRESTAASVLRTGVEAVTPFRGIIRRVTGASAYAKKLEETIETGFARRGFLKGMAMKMNCAPPASPAWFQPAPPPRPAVRPAISRTPPAPRRVR